MKAKVTGDASLEKDTSTGVVRNTNTRAFNAFILNRKRMREKDDKINALEQTVRRMQAVLEEKGMM